jgi:hypothetical protein
VSPGSMNVEWMTYFSFFEGLLKLFRKRKQKDRLGRSVEGFALMFSLGGVGFRVCASVSRCPF